MNKYGTELQNKFIAFKTNYDINNNEETRATSLGELETVKNNFLAELETYRTLDISKIDRNDLELIKLLNLNDNELKVLLIKHKDNYTMLRAIQNSKYGINLVSEFEKISPHNRETKFNETFNYIKNLISKYGLDNEFKSDFVEIVKKDNPIITGLDDYLR